MVRTWTILAIVSVGALALIGQPAFAPADEVTIKVIEPDKPATPPRTEPGRTPGDAGRSAQPGEGARPAVPASGDRRLDGVMRRLGLTAEQSATLTPIFEAARKEREQADTRFRTKIDGLREQLRQASGDQEKSNALNEQLRQAYTERREAGDQAGKQLAEKVLPVLTEDQAKRFKDSLDDSPQARNRRMAAGALRFIAGDVDLTEQQQEQAQKIIEQNAGEFNTKLGELRDQIQPLWEKLRNNRDDAEARKALDEMGAKMRTLMQERMAATRKAVDEVLTPEQRAKAEQARQTRAQDMAQRMVEFRVRAFEAAALSDEQKAKVDSLAAAAREAMGKLPADDWQARGGLSEQLRADIEKLLSDEQKAKVAAQGRRGGGFFGRGGGQPGAGGPPGQGGGGRRGRGNRGSRGGQGDQAGGQVD